jgi:hypothetical protein
VRRCGASMVPCSVRPRSENGKWGPWFLCSSRIADTSSCAQTPIGRELLDSGVFTYFEQGLGPEGLAPLSRYGARQRLAAMES